MYRIFRQMRIPARFTLLNRASTSYSNKGCWQCHKDTGKSIFCEHCKTIQPLRDVDYYSYMKINFGYGIEETSLRNKFRQLQSTVHPDKFAQKSEIERRYSDDHSSFLNTAYNTLKDPTSRAKYIVQLLDKVSSVASGTQTSDSETEELLEFMDLNDRIQTEESTSKLKGLAEKLNGEIDAILRDIHDHFKQNEISKVKKCLNKLSYLRRLRSNVNDKLGIDDQLD